ncbi:hypothetical protein LCGC14_0969490 [marine sediment metagenome]|uniref:Uncharacterized protein n=1 Tax=marine sediment metagenome TaxID=412755 RepID=A0A0F9QV82_9ZZZZ
MKIIQFKKGWVTRDFVIAGLLFTGIIAMFVLFVGGMASEYNQPDLVSSSFSSNYDQLGEISNKVEVMRATTAAGEGLSLIGAFDIAFTATFTVIQLVFSTLALAGSIPAKIIIDFTFIDSTVAANFFILGLAVLTTTIVFVWISSVSRGKI